MTFIKIYLRERGGEEGGRKGERERRKKD